MEVVMKFDLKCVRQKSTNQVGGQRSDCIESKSLDNSGAS